MSSSDDIARLAELRAAAVAPDPARAARPGTLPPRSRIHRLVDADTFFEIGQLAVSQQPTATQDTPADGIITGFAEIGGVRVAVLADDPLVLARTDGQVGKAKRRRMLKLALQEHLPVVLLLDEPDGATPTFDPLAGELLGKLADQHDMPALERRRAPLVAVAFSTLRGQRLELLHIADVTAAVADASCGGADFVEGDDDAALRVAAAALTLICESVVATGEEVGTGELADVSGAELVRLISDPSTTLLADLADGGTLVAGLVRIGGVTHAVVACDGSGALSASDVQRLGRSVAVSSRWRLPLLLIQDCAGYSAELATDAVVTRRLADVASAMRSSDSPTVVLVVGDGHVLGSFCLGGRELEPDYVVAWPWARLAASDPPSYDVASLEAVRGDDPFLAAGLGFVDDVVTPQETGPLLRWVARLLAGGAGAEQPSVHERWYGRGSIRGV